jgi:hypothetical protein
LPGQHNDNQRAFREIDLYRNGGFAMTEKTLPPSATGERSLVEQLRSRAWEDRQHRELRSKAADEIERLQLLVKEIIDVNKATASAPSTTPQNALVAEIEDELNRPKVGAEGVWYCVADDKPCPKDEGCSSGHCDKYGQPAVEKVRRLARLANRAAEALKSSALSAIARTGSKLVPEQPTEAMIEAGVKDTRAYISHADAEEIYKAMLRFAPNNSPDGSAQS